MQINLKHYRILFFLFTIFYYSDTIGQSRIENLTSLQYKENIHISFVITPGQSCAGYQVHRSENEIDFEILYDYAGVCGDAIKSQTILYTDSDPLKNTTAYYRVFIPPSDYSLIITARYFEFPSSGYILFSNPASSVFKALVNSRYATAELYNLKGEKLSDFVSDADGLLLHDISDIPSGLYYFVIKTGENVILKGKFIKE